LTKREAPERDAEQEPEADRERESGQRHPQRVHGVEGKLVAVLPDGRSDGARRGRITGETRSARQTSSQSRKKRG
jgi:hypothetical protein